MAKTTKFTKTSRSKTGKTTKTVTSKTISKRDLKSQAIASRERVAMAKLNNDAYQKHVTRRMAGMEAAGSIVTPTTVALSNTNAFSSGGFDIVDNQPDKKEDTSDSSGKNNSIIWG